MVDGAQMSGESRTLGLELLARTVCNIRLSTKVTKHEDRTSTPKKSTPVDVSSGKAQFIIGRRSHAEMKIKGYTEQNQIKKSDY